MVNESSPYLLQHAHNPVNWYPWGDEALKKAKDENKMILISIGYSACHWCHVMEHESFEDTMVARIMNEHFVNIKVDREERPDVDNIYMTSCHLSSNGNCGWPLNAMALPDGRPFWAGTYFPKKDWVKVLEYFIKMKKDDPEKMNNFAERLTEGIKVNDEIQPVKTQVEFSTEKLKEVFKKFEQGIDFKKGGKNTKIKFPMPSNWQFLLEYYFHSKDKKALRAVTTTLDNMAKGGIYDQLGGGFARYSTDADWKVPHFEKMLYDNAQLVSLYSFAYQVTKDPMYERIVYETLDFIEREMTSKEGGFYSSYDADSEGEEGKFYVWSYDKIARTLQNDEHTEIFTSYYNVTKQGNWEHKNNILLIDKDIATIARKYNTSETKINNVLALAKQKLMAERNKRVKPGLDDKILTSWNALMIKGYADAYRVFGEERFKNAAVKNAKFLMKKMAQKDNRLNRNYKNKKSVINGFLDDYALMSQAFIALYQATFDEKWLYKSKDFTDYANKNFYDEETGLYFYTSDLDPPLIARKKEVSDNVIPASNSIMAKNLDILSAYFFELDYMEKSKKMMKAVSNLVLNGEQPYFYSNWLSHYLMLSKPPFEVAIVGSDYEKMRKEMDNYFLPNAILLGGSKEGSLQLLEAKLIAGETIIYVCKDKMCKSPVSTVQEALELME